jgi:hypothetical protein
VPRHQSDQDSEKPDAEERVRRPEQPAERTQERGKAERPQTRFLVPPLSFETDEQPEPGRQTDPEDGVDV